MTPLRAKMIRELELQRKAPKTIDRYVSSVAELAAFYNRSPDKISLEEIRSYVHHLIKVRKVAYSTCNSKVVAIRFFYREVLAQENLDLRIPTKRSGRLPEPLSRGEIRRLLDATANLKHRAILMTVYGGGLRVSELVHLLPRDIHSERMLIRVVQGKGRKDRYTLLSARLLKELREYWCECRPKTWLFEGAHPGRHVSVSTVQQIFNQAKARAGVERGKGIHSLRHSFATHLMEARAPLPVIQRLMGHKSLQTTSVYLHVTAQHMNNIQSPLELLRAPKDNEFQE